MSLKTFGAWVAVASAVVLTAIAVSEYDHRKTDDLHHEGASAEQVKECCERMDKLEAEEIGHARDAEGWKARIVATEQKNDWQDRRYDALQAGQGEVLQKLGRIEGTQAEILRRIPSTGSTGR